MFANGKNFRDALIANNFVNSTSEKVNIVLANKDIMYFEEFGPFNSVKYMDEESYKRAYPRTTASKPNIDLSWRPIGPTEMESMGQNSTSRETQGWLIIKGYEFRIGKNYGREGTYSLTEAQEYIDGHNIYSKWNTLDNNDGKGSYIISHGYLIEMATQNMRIGDEFSIIDIHGNKNTYKIVRFNLIPKNIFDMRDIYDAETNEKLGNNLLESKESYILSFCWYGEVAYAYAEKIK